MKIKTKFVAVAKQEDTETEWSVCFDSTEQLASFMWGRDFNEWEFFIRAEVPKNKNWVPEIRRFQKWLDRLKVVCNAVRS